MKRSSVILLLLMVSLALKGQGGIQNIVGKVSFISSQNTYVRFKSTAGISAGDTLFVSVDEKLIPVLKVTGLSSVSCVCSPINDFNFQPDHLIIARLKIIPGQNENKAVEIIKVDTISALKPDTSAVKHSKENKLKQDIRGSASVNSYSDFSNTSVPDSYRFRYSLSLDARNIANSRFSLDTYVSFRHKAGEWDVIKSDLFNGLKIFDLAVKYDLNESTRFTLGRKINERIASIGAIDGLQAEKTFGKFAIGVIAGYRPDYADYGFNTSLFQYGAYVGFDTKSTAGYTGTTLAFMQQTNNSFTDRRFLYFQNSSSLLKNINLFSTFEIDLYKLENDQPKSTFDLTSLYLSLRYRITRKLSVSGSYDTRKNIIYYETYKTYFDRIIETERRQGYRLQADYSITDYLMVGANAGYRYLKADAHPSKNINGYVTLTHIPGMKMFSSTISGTYLETAYINGWTGRINLSREFFNGKLQPGLGFSLVNYSLPENSVKINQDIAEANLTINFTRTLLFSVNYEGTFEPSAKYNRVYLQLRKRF